MLPVRPLRRFTCSPSFVRSFSLVCCVLSYAVLSCAVPAALVLVYRFVVASGDTDAGWWHVHDFIAAEMTRLDPIKPGALVMITLGGSLIASKAEVFTSDGMLAVAELVLSMFQTCPGLLR